MANILDYLQEVRESFSERPFSEVDSLVLSQLSYLNFSGLVPGPETGGFIPLERLAEDSAVTSLTDRIRAPEENGRLIRLITTNPRFRQLRLGGYVNIIDKEAEEQFSAVTFLLEDFTYIAYRGTDASYVAWKEDFNLAFLSPVPSQLAGAAYLDWAAEMVSGPLRAGGHSKGGNIAVYSSLFCAPETRKRITDFYSHDGPGFPDGILQSPEFGEMKERLHKTIPQSSLVGLLLQHQETSRVIRSDQFWLMQHDPFSWQVTDGSFETLESLSYGARFLDKSLNTWIASLSPGELSAFADALYRVLCALPGESFSDTPETWWLAVKETLNGLMGLDKETYSCILRTVSSLFSLVRSGLPHPSFSLPELNLPEIPAPRIKGFSPAPLAEAFLQKLPFRKSGEKEGFNHN